MSHWSNNCVVAVLPIVTLLAFEAGERIGNPETLQLSSSASWFPRISWWHLIIINIMVSNLSGQSRRIVGNCMCRSLSKNYKSCNPSIEGSHSFARDGPLPSLGIVLSLINFPFALFYNICVASPVLCLWPWEPGPCLHLQQFGKPAELLWKL